MNSSFIIFSILIALSFLTILIYNTNLKSKLISNMFLILCSIYLILIIIFDNKFIYEFLKSVITYIWYPNYLIFVMVVIVSVINLIINLFNKKQSFLKNIINYLLFSICFACYIIFLFLDIDVSIYSELYQSGSLIIMRCVTISFLIWILAQIIIKVGGKYEK